MMRKILSTYLLVIVLAGFVACQKDEIPVFDEKRGLSLRSDGSFVSSDSISYSFAMEGVQGNFDTIWIPIALTGKSIEQPGLSFSLQIDSKSTARENVHYRLTDMTYPAATTLFNYPIILLRTASLQNEAVSLEIKLADNANFVAMGRGVSQFVYEQVKISISDQWVQPTWWGVVNTVYFGPYSEVRYRFMIEVSGITNFSYLLLSFPMILNYQAMFRTALMEYEREHGVPLRDQNNQLITF